MQAELEAKTWARGYSPGCWREGPGVPGGRLGGEAERVECSVSWGNEVVPLEILQQQSRAARKVGVAPGEGQGSGGAWRGPSRRDSLAL